MTKGQVTDMLEDMIEFFKGEMDCDDYIEALQITIKYLKEGWHPNDIFTTDRR